MAGQYRFKDGSGNIVAQISASVDGVISFSGSQVDFSEANTINLGEVQLAGTASNALLLDGFDSQAFAFTSSIHPFTASIAETNTFTSSATARLNSIETISASNISRLNSLEEKTGSLASTGSNTFIGTQTITGSLYISSDLIVQGSSSLQNITASAVSIGTNIVNLNTANPAIRYAGLVIGDSGSIGSSGSFFYDSVQDEMIFVHRGANTTVTSSVVLMGPQTYDSIGSETYLTNNRLVKGTGNEHIVDSNISDTGTLVSVNSPSIFLSGSVGIGTTSPAEKLSVNGAIISTAGITGHGANRTTLSQEGANGAYWQSYGTNSSTVGTFVLRQASSDFSIQRAAMLIDTTGAVTINSTAYDVAKFNSTYGQSDIVIQNSGTSFAVFGSGVSVCSTAANDDTGIGTAGLNKNIVFATGTSYSERMRISSTGLVGIGTTTFDGNAKVHISGQGSSFGLQIDSSLVNTGGSDNLFIRNTLSGNYTSIGLSANDADGQHHRGVIKVKKDPVNSGTAAGILQFDVRNTGAQYTTAMTINALGYVGIGTTNPSRKVHIEGDVFYTGHLRGNNIGEKSLNIGYFTHNVANQCIDLRLGNTYINGWIEVSITGGYSNENTNGILRKIMTLGANPSNNIWMAADSRVVEDVGFTSENVYIGEIEWDSSNSTYRIPIFHLKSSGNDYTVHIKQHAVSGPLAIDNLSISSQYTRSAPSSRQYVNYNNRVFFNNSAVSYGNFKVQNGTGGSSAGFIVRTSDNTDESTYYAKENYWTLLGANANEGWKFRSSNGQNSFTLNAGTSGYGGTMLGSLTQNASDIRLKTNITKIENALDKINSLEGFTYNWNDLCPLYNENTTIKEVGLSAQAVKEILPEVVSLAGFDRDNEDETKSKSGENYLTIQYEKLVPLLIEGIKELKIENDILKERIGVLENK